MRILAVLALLACHVETGYINPDSDPGNDSPPIVPGSWAKHIAGSSTQATRTVAHTTDGDVIVAGTFEGGSLIDLGGGPLIAAGIRDIFLAKFDRSGQHVWSKQLGVYVATQLKIRVVSNGDLVLAGEYRDTATFGTTTFTSAGRVDVFVARFSSNGEPLWAKSAGTADDSDDLGDLAIDGSGNIAISGSSTGTGTLFGSPSLTMAQDAWIVVVDPEGAYRWHQTVSSGASARLTPSYVVDFGPNGDVFLAASFVGVTSAGGGMLTSNGGLGGQPDWFLVRYSASNGAHMWSTVFGGNDLDVVHDIAVKGASVVVAGRFKGTVSFAGTSHTSKGETDGFLVKLDSTTGGHQSSVRVGGFAEDSIDGISLTDAIVSAVGSFRDSADFGGTALSSSGLNSFVVDLDGSSTAVISARVVNASFVYDVSNSDMSVVVGGAFFGNMAALGQVYINSDASSDGYVIRFQR